VREARYNLRLPYYVPPQDPNFGFYLVSKKFGN